MFFDYVDLSNDKSIEDAQNKYMDMIEYIVAECEKRGYDWFFDEEGHELEVHSSMFANAGTAMYFTNTRTFHVLGSAIRWVANDDIDFDALNDDDGEDDDFDDDIHELKWVIEAPIRKRKDIAAFFDEVENKRRL